MTVMITFSPRTCSWSASPCRTSTVWTASSPSGSPRCGGSVPALPSSWWAPRWISGGRRQRSPQRRLISRWQICDQVRVNCRLQAQNIAKAFHCNYYECSALRGVGLRNLFDEAVRSVLSQQQQRVGRARQRVPNSVACIDHSDHSWCHCNHTRNSH